MTDKKCRVDSIAVRLRDKGINGPVTQGQENVKPFSASAGGLCISKSKPHEKCYICRGCERIFFFFFFARCYTGKGVSGRVGFQWWWDWLVLQGYWQTNLYNTNGHLVDCNVVARGMKECPPSFPLGAKSSISANSVSMAPYKIQLLQIMRIYCESLSVCVCVEIPSSNWKWFPNQWGSM